MPSCLESLVLLESSSCNLVQSKYILTLETVTPGSKAAFAAISYLMLSIRKLAKKYGLHIILGDVSSLLSECLSSWNEKLAGPMRPSIVPSGAGNLRLV